MPTLYIIAGPNGAGKTTAAKTLLPEIFGCGIFINADEIAAVLNKDNPEKAALQSGRIMRMQIGDNLVERNSFCIETTLAAKSYLQLVSKARLTGYEVVLIFLYLPSSEMAKQRVALRVLKGGHNIPPDVIERRYISGIRNLFQFIKIADNWVVYQNDRTPPELIAEGEFENKMIIYNFELWESLKEI